MIRVEILLKVMKSTKTTKNINLSHLFAVTPVTAMPLKEPSVVMLWVILTVAGLVAW